MLLCCDSDLHCGRETTAGARGAEHRAVRPGDGGCGLGSHPSPLHQLPCPPPSVNESRVTAGNSRGLYPRIGWEWVSRSSASAPALEPSPDVPQGSRHTSQNITSPPELDEERKDSLQPGQVFGGGSSGCAVREILKSLCPVVPASSLTFPGFPFMALRPQDCLASV